MQKLSCSLVVQQQILIYLHPADRREDRLVWVSSRLSDITDAR